ncbi:MAG: hypothetical protein M0Z55_11050 [Peptococcaceae bacterium]|nr:hypothetical protein [Peptococcaceae bacterium]
MKKIKLQAREKIIVAIAVMAIIGYLFYAFWFTAYNAKIDAAQTQLVNLQSQIKSDQNLLNQPGSNSAPSPQDQTARQMATRLPMVQAAPSVIEALQNELKANALTVQNVTLDVTANSNGNDPALNARSVNIAFTGTYANVYKALSSVEKDQGKTYVVSQLALNTTSGKLSGSMTIQIYFSKISLPGYPYKPLLVNQGKQNPFAK